MKSGDSKSSAQTLLAIKSTGLRPHVVHLVPNGVRQDSRVLKSAISSSTNGRSALVVGVTEDQHFKFFETDGVAVLLVPFNARPGAPSAPPRQRARDAWAPRERSISLYRAGRALGRFALRASVRSAYRALTRRAKETLWSAQRRNLLDLNVAFADVLDAFEPTSIHVHDAHALPAAVAHAARRRLRRGRPVQIVYDSHECLTELASSYPESRYYSALQTIEREYIHEASNVVTVSEQIAELLKNMYGLDKLPTVVTNGPSAVRDASAPSLRQTLGIQKDATLAVYSGWVSEERGLATVLKAMTELPTLQLAFVVDPKRREMAGLLEMARDLGVGHRVHLADYVPPSQITSYLTSADVGLIPFNSGRHLELSLPTKFREYAHAGLPLVVSDHRAMREEVERTKIGLAFKAGDASDLARALRTVLDNPDRYRERITPELLAGYTWESQSAKLSAVYHLPDDSTQVLTESHLVQALESVVTRGEVAAGSPG